MLRRLRQCRITGIVAIACFATACVTTSNRMTPEVFSAMKSAEIFIVRAQKEIDMRISGHPLHADNYQPGGAYVHVPVNTGGGGGGGAAAAGILIVAAIANSVKQKKANEWVAPVREAVPDAEIEERLKTMIDRDFRAIQWIKPVPVPILDDKKNVVLEEKLYTTKADAVGLVTPYYQFDYSMTTLRVGMYFELFSASEALTKIVGSSQSQPVPYYAVHRYWDVSVPAEKRGETEAHAAYWAAENGKHTRAALAEGVEFAAAQIRETVADPQIYRPNQVIVQKPDTPPKVSKGFKTATERNNWYAIRFSEVETKWNEKDGPDSQKAMKKELDSLAAECRAAEILDETGRNDDACSVEPILEASRAAGQVTARTTEEVVGRPLKEVFRRLDTAEIKALFQDIFIENYPGHWQIEFSANGKWEGSQANWSPIDGYGTWTAEKNLHCLNVTDVSSYWGDVILHSCFQVWVDEVAGIVRMIDPAQKSNWVLAKEHAYGDIERMIIATETTEKR
ncbi:MAG: PAS domain-containing protein [Rhodospirillaceae bacterium]|nr:PAS domain-containing protein [Rhodospirillaceae bacterium]